MTRLSPKSEAAAFRIWAYCQEREWNCTVTEIAEGLDLSFYSVRAIVQRKGWIPRLPSRTPTDHYFGGRLANLLTIDHILDGGSYAQAFRAAGVPQRGACLE